MKITLVRHAEVRECYQKKYNGHIDIGLSSKGKQDAAILAKKFENTYFDAVFCSDLRRTKETLSPFVQYKDAIFTKELREKSWGKHEGMGFDEICQKYNIEYKNFQQWLNALDGEPYGEYISRIKRFFLEELVQKEYKNVLVVTHAGVIRILMMLVLDLSLEEAFCKSVPYGGSVIYDTKLQTFKEDKCNFS